MSKYTEEELAELTEEELEAINEDDGSDDIEVDEELEADLSGKGAIPEGEEELAAEEAEPEAEAKPEAEADPAPKEGDQEDDTVEVVAKEEVMPLLNGDIPEDVETKLSEINTKRSELDEKFDDGDLSTKEYRAEIAVLEKEQRDIEQALFKAQLSQEMTENQQRNAWKKTVDTFIKSNSEYKTSKLRWQTLDIAVKSIAADEANARLSGEEILAKAHEQVQSEFGLKPVAAEPAAEPPKQTSKTGKGVIPPNLGRVPAAETTETGNSKFKALDRLMTEDPERFEAEIGRLSESEQEAYYLSN